MTKQQVFEIIVKHTLEVLPELDGHSFQYTDRLVDLGANSIDRAEIVTMSLETLELKVPRVELGKVNNIGKLADALYERL